MSGMTEPAGWVPPRDCGLGNGSFTVDYRDTSDKFWSILTERRPIAIMSFSRWMINKEWMLDAWGTNWKNAAWTVRLDYTNNLGQPATMFWDRPYVGGSPQDPAPPSQGQAPQDGDPPDPTKPGADAMNPPTPPPPPANTRRSSNLPSAAIVAGIDAAFPVNRVDPKINAQQGPGDFVSNFLAYHVAWYREWWTNQNPAADETCLFSEHRGSRESRPNDHGHWSQLTRGAASMQHRYE
jgi:hypothetical protein